MYISQSMEFNNGNLILWCTDRFDLNSDITNNFIVVFSVDGKLLDSYNYPSLYKYEESEGIVYCLHILLVKFIFISMKGIFNPIVTL